MKEKILKTIEILKNCVDDNEYGVYCSDDCCQYGRADFVTHELKVALVVLQEQLGRFDGCEVCNDTESCDNCIYHSSDYYDPYPCEDCVDDFAFKYFKPNNYCSKCGKKLKEDD